MNALDKLLTRNNENKFVCVGLDTDTKKIPRHLFQSGNPVIEFNTKLILLFMKKTVWKGLRI